MLEVRSRMLGMQEVGTKTGEARCAKIDGFGDDSHLSKEYRSNAASNQGYPQYQNLDARHDIVERALWRSQCSYSCCL